MYTYTSYIHVSNEWVWLFIIFKFFIHQLGQNPLKDSNLITDNLKSESVGMNQMCCIAIWMRCRLIKMGRSPEIFWKFTSRTIYNAQFLNSLSQSINHAMFRFTQYLWVGESIFQAGEWLRFFLFGSVKFTVHHPLNRPLYDIWNSRNSMGRQGDIPEITS